MTIETERRSFIQGAGLAAAAASAGVLAAGGALAQTPQPSGGKKMPYQAKPMSFDPKSINGISEKVLVSHYQNNYVGAVNWLKVLEQKQYDSAHPVVLTAAALSKGIYFLNITGGERTIIKKVVKL